MSFINHSMANLICGCASMICPIMYLGVRIKGGILSFVPCGFNELFSHSSFENHRLLSVVSGESGKNVPVVILAKPPGFSNVGSFTLKSKSRLSYAIAQSPSVDKPWRTLFCSFVSALTIDGLCAIAYDNLDFD